jgi:CRISPR/Cas system endoribonuclease Cas6 (RAMP superfamily)
MKDLNGLRPNWINFNELLLKDTSIVTFSITCEHSKIPIHTTTTLKEIWFFIKNFVAVPQNYLINQIESGQEVDCCNAKFLITEYDVENLPQLISDINYGSGYALGYGEGNDFYLML